MTDLPAPEPPIAGRPSPVPPPADNAPAGAALAGLSLAELVTFPAATLADWQAEIDRLARAAGAAGHRAPIGPPSALTLAGIPVDLLHTRVPGIARADDLAAPPAHAATGWRIEQHYDHPDPAEVNRQIHADLERGAGGIWLRADPRGSDLRQPAPLSGTGSARVGPAALDGLARALDGVRLELVHVAFDAGLAAPALAAAVLGGDFLATRGVPPAEARLAFDFDPLGQLAAASLDPDGSPALDPPPGAEWPDLWRALGDAIATLGHTPPGVRTIAVSTLPYHDAGATAIHELAYALATAVEYLRAAADLGWPAEAASRQIRFVFGVGNELFTEIAKLRAARRLWRRVLCALGPGVAPAAGPMVIHAVTSPRARGTRDPWVNLVRGTTQTLAAVIGGADSVTTLPFDGVVGAASDLGRRLAVHTQSILQAEAHVHRIADAAAGSAYVEHLTDAVARQAWATAQAIEHEGGMRRAILAGRIARDVAQATRAQRAAAAAGTSVVVGETHFLAPGAEGGRSA